MSLIEYEKLVIGRSEVRGLTEDELLDKINRDIAIWKSEQELENLTNLREIEAEFKTSSNLEPIKDVINKTQQKTKKRWTIPKEIKEGAEEVIEEDRQYLHDLDVF